MTLDTLDTKGLLSSGVVWGVLASALPQIINSVSDALASGSIPIPPQYAGWITLVGSVFAIFKRATATKKISGL